MMPTQITMPGVIKLPSLVISAPKGDIIIILKAGGQGCLLLFCFQQPDVAGEDAELTVYSDHKINCSRPSVASPFHFSVTLGLKLVLSHQLTSASISTEQTASQLFFECSLFNRQIKYYLNQRCLKQGPLPKVGPCKQLIWPTIPPKKRGRIMVGVNFLLE